MDEERLRQLLENVQDGSMPLDRALSELVALPYRDLGYAKVDHHRALRKGFPEVIFCQGKTDEHIVGIASEMTAKGSSVLATRAAQNVYERLRATIARAEYFPEARIIFIDNGGIPETGRTVLVASGGTADLPVAEEAAVTAAKLGNRVERLYDVGVAGVHRLLDHREELAAADVVVVVAGMEGALPGVVAGLIDAPVVAVPTSVGYGCNLGGLTALFAMLSSCSSGMGVVNIDNGFGAGYLAATITRARRRR